MHPDRETLKGMIEEAGFEDAGYHNLSGAQGDKQMKQAVNFRLSKQTTNTLAILEKKMHTSKTDIVEKAIELFAKQQMSHKHALLKFAGTLSDTAADDMLTII